MPTSGKQIKEPSQGSVGFCFNKYESTGGKIMYINSICKISMFLLYTYIIRKKKDEKIDNESLWIAVATICVFIGIM